MTKVEFESRLCDINEKAAEALTYEEYKVIEYVYTWHPCIDAVRGKEQIAYLYAEFGMLIIRDMLPTARRAEEFESQINKAKAEYDAAKEQYERLKSGKM